MLSPASAWDPEERLWDRVVELFALHFGAVPGKSSFSRFVHDIKRASRGGELTFNGLEREAEILASMDALAVWLVKQLCDVPDGVESLLEELPAAAGNVQSSLYNACLETLRTSKGTFFSAEDVATRIQLDLVPRRRAMRQLRRLLLRVCNDNGARVRRDGKNRTLYGFR